MRILLISGSLPPMKCGVGDYTAHLAKALGRCKNTSVAVLTDVAATPIPSDFEFEVFPIAHGWRMFDAVRIAIAVRHWRPDIVHIQYPTQGYGRRYLPWLLPIVIRLLNVPIVETWHEYHLERVRRNILNAALGGGLIAVRPNYKAMMPGWYRWLIRRKHFQFIPNASAIPRVRLSERERFATQSRFAPAPAKLIVYFGFVHPAKRVELLFEIADPAQDHLVLICDLNSDDAYHKTILDRIDHEPWAGKVTVTGFLPAEEVGRLLAAAAAVIFPFRDGAGEWNTSIRAAAIQGTFVLTTADERHGYYSSENVYYARPDDIADMGQALRTYVSSRSTRSDRDPASDWEAIADAHKSFYESVL
jgi:glycosyltransferase involved in cell wall biosynthesis